MPAELSVHSTTCQKRPITCKYCENKYASCEFQKHEDACGARTRPCNVCQRPVMLKEV